ncbi:helix-turn-helix protein [Halopolyspora algeriensis]|uniref:Helix-turn-helix protein n=1 Tax=Halopolyspora algeriensis TaxID=1500506 RepID=A0A368VVZ0_9ACTN|nr:helix-turn-helix transcriptional regulator [Halopolyspora algeriensis]RCW46274.1 helix-turn-helix protein [Halopolyspora algeriensis]TQM55676.1 helix-turn-helix protein [Halopolyspora algeriensis]
MALRKTARSRRLGGQIRRLREDAQLNQESMAERINAAGTIRRMSASHLSRVESGLSRIEPDQLDCFITALKVSEATAAQLKELQRRANEKGYWQEYRDIVPEPVEMLAELGEDAITARSFDYAFIQGLLQTRAYAEEVVNNARAFVRPIDIDRLVELRMQRQKRLNDPGFEGLTAVMTEDVLRRVVGSPALMRAQLQHLNEVARDAKVTIHIYPHTAGALPGADNLVIFTFPHEDDGEAVFVDSDTASRIYEHERDPIRQCTYTFDAALARSLPARESLDLIAAVEKEYR